MVQISKKALFWGSIMGLAMMGTSCKTSSKVKKEEVVEYIDYELEPVEVTANRLDFDRAVYNPSYTRRNDLLHTDLEVRFDWNKKYLLGKAKLTIKPLFYPTDSLRLDAKGFDIQKVAILQGGQEKKLQYKYEDQKNLSIQLDRSYSREESYQILVEYTAKPDELPIGGSAAITADKGLYFINPDGKNPDKPQQIWTQGETESSSCWFPTIDRPNERTTQEIKITVQDRFQTLSNGLLISSRKNEDGSRTDHWKMEQNHAPYLFMMAIGEFARSTEEWNGKLLEYYVEAKYAEHAKAIFPQTPEMLSFFSARLGYEYPWPKYSQVVVRDYVSGAMENTTGVIFGEYMQKTSRELIDNTSNEGVVAHEMMHHWFGDLVTCESWANLPLNESFANYGEYLWFEHRYGRDFADYKRMNEVRGYMNQAVLQDDAHPLIHYGYEDKEDMFDAHSYNKGGAILHMLRKYLGDDAFFESLKHYLHKNEYSAAEADELRLAFEEVTGEDLNWFFNQWFYKAGHPKLKINRSYSDSSKTLVVELEQTQDYSQSTVFILPMELAIYTPSAGDLPIIKKIRMAQQKQRFEFPLDEAPTWVAVDRERMLLAERAEEQSKEEWGAQYRLSPRFQDRYDALQKIKYDQGEEKMRKLFWTALQDPAWPIRAMACDYVKAQSEEETKTLIAKLSKMAEEDPHSQVRMAALQQLGRIGDASILPSIKKIMGNQEEAYSVIYGAFKAIQQIDQNLALELAKELEQEQNPTLLMGIAELYGQTGDRQYLPFFSKNWQKTENYGAISFFGQYQKLLVAIADDNLTLEKVKTLKEIGSNPKNDLWHRYAAANALYDLQKAYFEKAPYEEIQKALKTVIEKEENSNLKNLYQNWKVN